MNDLIYILFIIIWAFSIKNRTIYPIIRKLLYAVCGLMVLFILLKMSRYTYLKDNPDMIRHIWYLYYIPMLMIPTILYGISYIIKKGFVVNIARVRILFLPMIMMITGMITNDLHQLAFEFPTDEMDS